MADTKKTDTKSSVNTTKVDHEIHTPSDAMKVHTPDEPKGPPEDTPDTLCPERHPGDSEVKTHEHTDEKYSAYGEKIN